MHILLPRKTDCDDRARARDAGKIVHLKGIRVEEMGAWAAVVVEGDDIHHELSGTEAEASAFRMDLTAAIAALEQLPTGATLTIHAANGNLEPGLTGWSRRWRICGWTTLSHQPVKHRDLWERLIDLAETRNILWADSDPSNLYMRRCHYLAREAILRRRIAAPSG